MNEDILKRTRGPHYISEELGIPLTKAQEMVDKADFEVSGWGPGKKQKHIGARRRSMAHWSEDDQLRIHHYRKLHDQGRVNLCQGRDGDFFLLYAMPNKSALSRMTYFYSERGY